MKYFIKAAVSVAILSTFSVSAQGDLPKLGKDPLEKIIAAMTDDEKTSLVMGTGIPGFGEKIETEGFVNGRVPGAAGNTFPIGRLGIPSIIMADGPAGLRISPTRKDGTNTYYATAFPVATSLASTWNLSLVEKVGKAMGNEAKEYGVDVLLAPALNIHRNPLCGRNFEYYSEDPLVSGKTAMAMINGIESQGVGASIKHFAANNQETNRLSINEHISQRAMREIYLRGFEIAIKESKPWTVMSSYNLVDGVYTSARKDLLTDILRNEWGYKGVVMSDWFAGYHSWKTIKDSTYSSDVTGQLTAGNDLLMPGMKAQKDAMLAALKNGKLSREILDRNVKRVLELILESPRFKQYPFSNKPKLMQNAEIARDAASEGMVLLKNKGTTLPYKNKTAPIAVFGVTSYNFISGGTGSGDVNEAYTVSLIEGLNNAGYLIDSELQNLYIPFSARQKKEDDERRKKEGILALAKRFPEMDIPAAMITKKAASSDVAIITIGRNSGENGDRKTSDDFNLANDELGLIRSVCEAFHKNGKKVIVILNIGGVIETASWKDLPDSILLAWQPGQEGGNSVADVLSGKANPSGKLTMTWPLAYEDTPSAKNFPGTPANDPKEVTYEEGIYVGYRYFQAFNKKTSYDFGFGMSYTKFDYSDIKVSDKVFRDNVIVSITIKNTGKVAGKEVVELYLSAPSPTIDKPRSELRAYTKTKLLRPGESQVLTATLHQKDLASFYEDKNAWMEDAGSYMISIGASSSDIRKTISFEVKTTQTVEEVTKAFTPDIRFTELKP